MKYVKLFEQFKLDESIEKNGLDYFTNKHLNTICSIKMGSEYKDESPKILYRFFTYNAGWPVYGFPNSYLKKLGNKFSDIIKEAKTYLKNGTFPEQLVTMLATWEGENTSSRGTRVEDNIKNMYSRIATDFKPENKEHPDLVLNITKLIEILTSWNSTKLLSRINLAASLLDETSYSAYAGSDFETAFPYALKAVRKNKIAITPVSDIKFSKDSKVTDQSSKSGSGRGDDYIQIDRTSRSNNLSITVDGGQEYFVHSYDTESAYGHY
jgi:hypothetical protein